MTPLEATEAIYLAAVTGVAAMAGPPEIKLDELAKPAIGTTWIRLSVKDGPTRSMSIGPIGQRRAERSGTVYAQCFHPVSLADGVGPALAMAQEMRALFEGKDLTGAGATAPPRVTFEEGAVRRMGVDGSWTQVNAEIPFTYVEIV